MATLDTAWQSRTLPDMTTSDDRCTFWQAAGMAAVFAMLLVVLIWGPGLLGVLL